MKRFLSILACVALIFSLSTGLCMASEGEKDTTKQGDTTKDKPKGNDLDS